LSVYRIVNGFATAEGTLEYMQHAISNGKPRSHFREFDGLHLTSIGMGTYLGSISQADDLAVEDAIFRSVSSGGINVIDTALNYRAMLSEKCIGRAIFRLLKAGVKRQQVFICSKNGYITNDAEYPGVSVQEYIQKMFVEPEVISPTDISSGSNVMNPNYLARCIDKSLMNMHLSTIDLIYLHNAFESWHRDVSRPVFMEMLAKAFELYEKYRQMNKLRYYGLATWTCFRVPSDSQEYLSLEQVVKVAEEVGGKNHGFRFIQLPYNLGYREAYFAKYQTYRGQSNLSVIEVARKLGIGVFTSVPLMQGRLLEEPLTQSVGTNDRLTIALQFARSTPGVLAPLIGQKSESHVNANLKITDLPPLTEAQFFESIPTAEQR
jgi:aryl-alcohol dehydrogenase-like predicted oxidoreductase